MKPKMANQNSYKLKIEPDCKRSILQPKIYFPAEIIT
jgi:hypothetical protein